MTTDITPSLKPSAVYPNPPCPTGLAAAATWLGLARDPWLYPNVITDTYGDVVRLPIPGVNIVLLGGLDEINYVAVTNAGNYRRSDWVAAEMKPVEHRFRFFAFTDDADWARGRKLMKPQFSKRALLQLEDLFTEAITDQLDRWDAYARNGEVFDLQRRMKALTLAVLFNALFSERLDEARLQWLVDRLTVIMEATTVRTLTWSLPRPLPRPMAKRGIKAQRELDAFLAEIIAHRRANPVDTGDVLNLLLDAKYEDGTALEDEKIMAEMVGLVIGGFDTTSAAMTWMFAQIARHPDVEKKLLYELGAFDEKFDTPTESSRFEYARACFDEAQRLQGGLVINPKVAVSDDVIGGYRIKAGTIVTSSNIAVHRDRRYWPDPHAYRPERWVEKTARRDAYIPFGRGSRLCLGQHMAYIEAAHTLSIAFSRYRFELQNPDPRPKYRMAVEVKGGLPVRIERR